MKMLLKRGFRKINSVWDKMHLTINNGTGKEGME